MITGGIREYGRSWARRPDDSSLDRERHPAPGVLLTGASGFIGSAIAREIGLRRPAGLRTLVHITSGAGSPAGRFAGDLRDRASLDAATAGVRTVIHAAGYLGRDPVLQDAVNVAGTQNLVQAARESGVERVVYVSTAAVYGSGPHRGASETALHPAPESSLSLSRRRAEEIVLAHGGFVVRPNLVVGIGDRRVLGPICRLMLGLDAVIDEGRARLSVIRVDDLATLVTDLAFAESTRLAGSSVYHAADETPVRLRDLLDECVRTLGFRMPRRSVSLDDALLQASRLGVTRHQLSMVALDHWYDAGRLWALADRPSPARVQLDARAVRWYRDSGGFEAADA